jgi:hypothetical protein
MEPKKSERAELADFEHQANEVNEELIRIDP